MTTPTAPTQTPATTPPGPPTGDENDSGVLTPTPVETDAATGAHAETEPDSNDDNPNAESAKWRKNLRVVEAERDTLLTRIEAFQRADILRIAGEQLAVADDLFTVGGTQLVDLLDDDGNVDSEKLNGAIAELLDTRGGLSIRAKTPPRDAISGSWGYGQSVPRHASPSGWAEVFK